MEDFIEVMDWMSLFAPLLSILWMGVLGLAAGIVAALAFNNLFLKNRNSSEGHGATFLVYGVLGLLLGGIMGWESGLKGAMDGFFAQIQPPLEEALGQAGLDPEALPLDEVVRTSGHLVAEFQDLIQQMDLPFDLNSIDVASFFPGAEDLRSLSASPENPGTVSLSNLYTFARNFIYGALFFWLTWIYWILWAFVPLYGLLAILHIPTDEQLKEEAEKKKREPGIYL